MSKLTKSQARLHHQAEDLLAKDTLTHEDKLFVLEHWREDGQHVNSTSGAFFTPWGLALDFALEVSGRRIIDLCAGIGTLSLACLARHEYDLWQGAPPLDITCVEVNPAYVEVGRKVVPEARWICASIFDMPDLGRFDVAISNPPFGQIKRDGDGPRYRGGSFEYHVIDIAATLADEAVLIVPQTSAGFSYSGKRHGGYQAETPTKLARFTQATGIALAPGMGIDTARPDYGQWHGVAPRVEVVLSDFEGVKAAPERVVRLADEQPYLLDGAA